MTKNIIITKDEALRLTGTLGDKFAVVHNPDFIHPSIELYPLTSKILSPKLLKAVVMDMDGTTTTTENICIHSLEFMIRKITGRMDVKNWNGLNQVKDYPHIIGNSTTKHAEYLVKTYKKHLKQEELKKAFIFAVVWTLKFGKDKKRNEEVVANAIHLVGKDFLNDKILKSFVADKINLGSVVAKLYKIYSSSFNKLTFTNIVKASVDIYYQRYHEILGQIHSGQADKLVRELFSDSGKHLIEPMPGVAVFFAMIKGLLGEEIKCLLPNLLGEFKDSSKMDKKELLKASRRLIVLSKKFEKNPLKIAVVTSSIFYEADIVLSEVFKIVYKQAEQWEISLSKKKKILEMFKNYRSMYDGFVTASDSNEIRLKPHRDLYSIALHQLDIAKKDLDKVMGLEDSESGTFAIRAAGIGLCVAVPFAQTTGHNFEAAAHIAYGGLPEIMLKHSLYLK